MSGWDALAAELDRWAEDGRTAEFWWRDDDAVDATPALGRLLSVQDESGVPLALAVIPAKATGALAAKVSDNDGLALLQHGYAHANHRPEGAKKAELGADRPLWDIAREIAEGRTKMDSLFGEGQWLETMVPPWNRIDDPVAALLPGLGFQGLSAFRARRSAEPVPRLSSVNVHVDVIDWRGSRGFAGEEACLAAAVAHLAAKRSGSADADEPTGLLTHHLVQDADCWTFVSRFVAETRDHSAGCWRAARDLFPDPE